LEPEEDLEWMTVGMVFWRERDGMMMTTGVFFNMDLGGEAVVVRLPSVGGIV